MRLTLSMLARTVLLALLAPATTGFAAAPAPAPAPPKASAPPGPAATPARASVIRGDAVLIEGKLYSPQALFIVSRTAETFGRDAIVPHTLDLAPSTALAPYRLRPTAPADSTARDEH